MRYFSKPTSLERLSLEARILYTAFCLFLLIGFTSSVWLYRDDGLDASTSSAVRYYLGASGDGETAAPPQHSAIPAPAGSRDPAGASGAHGPALQIPEVEEPGRDSTSPTDFRFAKPPRQVMETFHFHLLTVPVCLLIIGHLFMMTGLSTKMKAWILGIGALSTLVHLLLPPLIRFASPRFAVAMLPSAISMGATWTFLTIAPVVEMWRRPLSGAKAPRPPSEALEERGSE